MASNSDSVVTATLKRMKREVGETSQRTKPNAVVLMIDSDEDEASRRPSASSDDHDPHAGAANDPDTDTTRMCLSITISLPV